MATFLSSCRRKLIFMYKYIIAFSLIISSFLALAGEVIIEGKAPESAGKTIAVFIISDYISEKRELMQAVEISANGDFLLNFDVKETRVVLLSITRVEGLIYVEPGKTYHVNFPSEKTAEIKKFDRTQIELGFENLPANDLNVLIRNFNADFISFINKHFYDFAINEYSGSEAYLKAIGAKTQQSDLYKTAGKADSSKHAVENGFSQVLTNFILDISSKYEQYYSIAYFEDYVTYSIAELELMAGKNRIAFYRDYFMSKSLRLQNPAYMRCFDIFYNNFLTNQSKEKQSSIAKAINVERNADLLIAIFEGDSTALSGQVRMLAVIKGLNEIYFNKNYSRGSIEQTLNSLGSDSKELKFVADNVLSELRKCSEGWLLEDFTLVDQNEQKWRLSEHDDVTTYFLFFASWNNTALKEMQIMKNLKEKYGKNVQFVAINMDDDYETFKKYMQNNKEQKFTYLYAAGDPLITEKFNLRTIPHAVMLDDSGHVMFSFTRKPSEGIQMDFDKIVQMSNQKQQGPKTWKDKN